MELVTEQLDIISNPSSLFHQLDKQQQFIALTSSIATRAADLARMVAPGVAAEALRAFDDGIYRKLCSLVELNGRPEDHPAHIAQIFHLPPHLGGFGVRSQLAVSNAAYLSGFLSGQGAIQTKWPQLADLIANIATSELPTAVTLQSALQSYNENFTARDKPNLLHDLLPEGLVGLTPADTAKFAGLQKKLTAALNSWRKDDLLRDNNMGQKAWLRACSGPEAGAFLHALPRYGDNVFTDREFVNAMQRRLYVAQTALLNTRANVPGKCPAQSVNIATSNNHCNSDCNTGGAHLTTCTVGGGAIALHDCANEAVAVCMRMVFPSHHIISDMGQIEEDMRARLDVPTPLDLPYPRPDIVKLGENPLIIDTCIVEPRKPTYVVAAAAEDGATAAAGEANKLSLYTGAWAYMPKHQFVPFAIETGGRIGKQGRKLLYDLARIHEAKVTGKGLRDKLGRIGGRFLMVCRQRISVALQREQSRRILAISDRAYAHWHATPRCRGQQAYSYGEIAAAVTLLG